MLERATNNPEEKQSEREGEREQLGTKDNEAVLKEEEEG
jgi:hypothetical protein